MDASESPLSTSPSQPPSLSPQRHFYLAVDRLQFKMETLLGLLGMAGRRPCLPMIVCCSTRDELDAVCSNLSSLSSYVSYSDLSEVDRAEVLDKFRQATMTWNRLGRGEEAEREADQEQKSHIVVVTDACLPLPGTVEVPLCACMLINYGLPTKKVLGEQENAVVEGFCLMFGLSWLHEYRERRERFASLSSLSNTNEHAKI
ncbi:uncharacterized protein LOC130989010 isoform X6 [Salvia miltiorrhiza]|uniref:uncharacterized protein LOC130989010 isoform X6 n=1 Tax=Salvia miltiorrhiza TaxID=226208 RepID=UPI0025AD3321|nr:uncharacterized protein LOC130989010 isoform X6 [Salvia miltiorrhiza]